jgi:hypothetical protein
MIKIFQVENQGGCRCLPTIRRKSFLRRYSEIKLEEGGAHDAKLVNKSQYREFYKRKARLQLKIPQIFENIQQKWNLNDNFVNHRGKIVKIIQNNDNIDALFKNSSDSFEKNHDYIEDYQQLRHFFGQLSYYNSEMQTGLYLICQYLLNSIIVELNLRNLFKSPEIIESDFLYRNLIETIKQNDLKIEILKILNPLLNNDVKPKNFTEFFQNLNQLEIQTLLNQLKFNHDFDSVEIYRYLFHNIKSSQYLNYEESDLTSFVKSNNFIKFQSNHQSNEEYIEKLDKLFDKYCHYLSQEFLMQQDEAYCDYLIDKSSKKFNLLTEIYQNHIVNVPNMQHLNLGLSIIKVLLTCNQYIPNYDLFKYLLDNLRAVGLVNYQSIIYKSLPLYIHKPSVLTENQTLQYYHFQPIVEQNPEILSSLLHYNSDRNILSTFQSLLSFFLLDDIALYESILSQSNLQGILSKSKYTRDSKRWLHSEVYFKSSKPLIISVDSVYTAIECCINLKCFEYIDSLFNKILIHGIENDNTLSILLTMGSSDTNSTVYEQLLAKQYTPQEIASKIFTKQIFKLLLKASRLSGDLGRLMWILPHLDNYLQRNLEHITHNTKENFNKDTPVDHELVSEIYLALLAHGLEGKIKSYKKFLQFDKIFDDPAA